MIALTRGTKLAMLFGGIGIAAGIGITLAVVSAQEGGEVQWNVVEDTRAPWEGVFKNIQETVRPSIKEKSQLYVGEEGLFKADARGGDKPYQFIWNFDDGYTSTVQNVTHSFESPGKHEVQLTAKDAMGRLGVISTTVQVLTMPEEQTANSTQTQGQ